MYIGETDLGKELKKINSSCTNISTNIDNAYRIFLLSKYEQLYNSVSTSAVELTGTSDI